MTFLFCEDLFNTYAQSLMLVCLSSMTTSRLYHSLFRAYYVLCFWELLIDIFLHASPKYFCGSFSLVHVLTLHDGWKWCDISLNSQHVYINICWRWTCLLSLWCDIIGIGPWEGRKPKGVHGRGDMARACKSKILGMGTWIYQAFLGASKLEVTYVFFCFPFLSWDIYNHPWVWNLYEIPIEVSKLQIKLLEVWVFISAFISKKIFPESPTFTTIL